MDKIKQKILNRLNDFDIEIFSSAFRFITFAINDRKSIIWLYERSIRVFSQLFAHAIYITTEHTCTYVAIHYHYITRVYSMIVLQT